MAFRWNSIPKVHESIDFLNVMTYDFMNRRDNVTKHHSGLSSTIDALHGYSDPGIYVRDLNFGLGFYIKWFKVAADEACDRVPPIGCRTELMEDPKTGADLGKAGAFSWHDEVPDELKESFGRAMRYGVDDWRADLLVGHCYFDKQERLFWSWDTSFSISQKLEKVFGLFDGHEMYSENDIGGVFAWGLGEDAPNFEHLKAVNKALELWEHQESEHEEL